MDSALRPRDIQARIRAGESVEDVARAAGVPVERIDAFAAPVIAERDHVAGLALANPVRRRGESTSNRPLRTATSEQLISRGIDPDDVSWDACLLGARRWRVTALFRQGERAHEALFVFDLSGRFSVADNEEARGLIGEDAPGAAAPAAGAAADDELALVRVVQGEFDDPDAEVDDAYTETELAEVDGVYDIVPGEDREMDALYDMLASFDEDSVRIYSGLVHPETFAPVVGDAPGAPSAETPELPEGARVEPLYRPDDAAAQEAEPESVEDAGGENDVAPADAVADEAPAQPTAGRIDIQPPAVAAPAQESEQPSLVEGEPAVAPRPKPRPRAKRASVPSWDEIMFGAPRQNPDKR